MNIYLPSKRAASTDSNVSSSSSSSKSSTPLKLTPKRAKMLLSSSTSAMLFGIRTKPGYFIMYCADGLANGKKSFSHPFDMFIKRGGEVPDDLFFIATLPRRATEDNDPVLFTFVSKKKYSCNNGFFNGYGKKEEMKAIPWLVSACT